MSLDDLQAQLRGTLDQQFAALKQKFETDLAEARHQAAADAGREAAVTLERARAEHEQARAEWETHLQAEAAARAQQEQQAAEAAERARQEHDQNLNQAVEDAVAATRATGEQQAAEAVERTRQEHEQKLNQAVEQAVVAARAQGEKQAAEAAAWTRQEHEQKLNQAVEEAVGAARRAAELDFEFQRRRTQTEVEASRRQAKADAEAELAKAKAVAEAERQNATAAVEAERQAAQIEIDALRQGMRTEIAAARQAVSAKAAKLPSAASGVPAVSFDRVAFAIRDIDGARTVSQALESLLAHAGAAAGRAAIFLINGDRLKPWKASVIPDIDVQTVESSIGAKDLMARAIQTGQATPSSASLPAPPFARLPADREGLAVPLLIDGRAVAVLYVDSGTNAPPAGSADVVDLLVRYASATVALRTALRTLDVLGGVPDGNGDGSGAGGGDVSDDQGARRYARLLVSEIKLYNEAAVRAGRQERDLLQRLRAEIDRAQRLYEERVSPAVGGRHVYFHQELVQTLADGDPALLGNQ